MGKLFWKFFLYLWLAQLTTMAGVSTFMWVRFHSETPVAEETAPPVRPFLRDRLAEHPHPPWPHHRLIAPLACGTAASLLFAALLAWRFSQPVRTLRDGFQRVAAGELDRRIGPSMASRGDELSDLGQEFDSMTAQLQTLLDNQRQLLHDVSHELRSPLARLQAIIGLMRQKPEHLDTLGERMEKESARIDRLLNELLTLSRLQSGTPLVDPDETVDIEELLQALLDDAQPQAQLADVRLQRSGNAPHYAIHGNAEWLYRALDNIVRNAIRHSPAHGKVTLSCLWQAGNPALQIAVDDQGSGVKSTDLPRLFTPFFRADNSVKSDGHGLGLAIAQRIAQAHNGTLVASNRSDGGLRLLLTLPAQVVSMTG